MPVLYRPFDVREMYYVPWMVDWPRTDAMPHMLAGENLSIGLTRSVEVGAGFSHIFASRAMIQHHTVSLKEVNYQIPLYLYPGVGKTDGSLFSRWPKGKGGRTPNLDSGFVEQTAAATELRFVSDGRGDLRKTFGAEDVFAYIYTVFHSPGYREPLRGPAQARLPTACRCPAAADLFRQLAEAGHDLLVLHLLEVPEARRKPITTYTRPQEPRSQSRRLVGRHRLARRRQDQRPRAANVRRSPAPSGSRVCQRRSGTSKSGGYQVCHKWLKDRKGRTLSDEDIDHYQKIVVALSETIHIMAEIDEVIEAHGGWPDVFQTKAATHSSWPTA